MKRLLIPGIALTVLVCSNLVARADGAKSDDYEGDRSKRREQLNPVKVLTQMATKGNAEAQMQLATVYYIGDLGVTKDPVKAVYWFEQAAAQDVALARFNLGLCYEGGDGVPQNEDTAIEYYMQAAKRGVIAAHVNAALLYRKRGDHGMATELFGEAAQKGNLNSMREYGLYLIKGVKGRGREGEEFYLQNTDEGLKYVEAAASRGDVPSQLLLADCYAGLYPNVKSDPAKVKNYLWQAVHNDSVEAIAKVGYCYEYGVGVTQDSATAVVWYRKAAGRGHLQAMVNIGHCYATGKGVAMDLAEAFKWYEKAAAENFPTAIYNLGVCYANGSAVTVDESEAFKHFLSAATMGSPKAQKALATCYSEGIGTAADPLQAQYWLDVANGLHDLGNVSSELPEKL